MNTYIDKFKDYVESPSSLISYMEHSTSHWHIKDNESRYIYMNKPLLEYINMPQGFDWEGRLDHEIPVAPCQELGEGFVKHDQEVMKEDRLISAVEIHYYGKGNTDTPVPHLCDKTPLYDNNNKCIGTVGHGRGIEAQELLFYMKRFNREIIEFDPPNAKFTQKELEIAFWLQQRLSYKEIGALLNKSNFWP